MPPFFLVVVLLSQPIPAPEEALGAELVVVSAAGVAARGILTPVTRLPVAPVATAATRAGVAAVARALLRMAVTDSLRRLAEAADLEVLLLAALIWAVEAVAVAEVQELPPLPVALQAIPPVPLPSTRNQLHPAHLIQSPLVIPAAKSISHGTRSNV
jgi:hypothetical protein